MPAPATEDQILAVYRETIDALYGYVSRMCDGERALAEDVTQETWLRAVRKWRSDGLPERPIAWLSTVARNLVLNNARRQRQTPIDAVPASELVAAIENGRSQQPDMPDDEIEWRAAQVHAALTRLPEPQASMLRAFYYDQHPVAAIAETFGLSQRAVEGRLRRARLLLEHELRPALKPEVTDHE